MDKKNTIIGVSLLVAAFAIFFLAPRAPAPSRPANAQAATASGTPASAAAAASTAGSASSANAAGVYAPVRASAAGGQLASLSNDFIEARLPAWAERSSKSS
jgi:YidC/Oxa1 family membrane protein insertase